MKNTLLKSLLALLLISIFSIESAFAHAWTNTRKTCNLNAILGKRYQAYAKISEWQGRWVTKYTYDSKGKVNGSYQVIEYNFYEVEYDKQESCNSCATADRTRSGSFSYYIPSTGWFNVYLGSAHAQAKNGPNCGGRIETTSNFSYLRAGCDFDYSSVDETYLNNNPGTASQFVDGYTVDIPENGTTVYINNLNGFLEIEEGSNFTSTMKVFILLDPNNQTEECSNINNTGLPVLYEAEVTMCNGVLTTVNIPSSASLNQSIQNGENRVDINGLNLEAVLPLGTNMDDISVIVYGHSGVTIPTSVSANKSAIASSLKLLANDIYPNPAMDILHIPLAVSENPFERIDMVDMMGRVVKSFSFAQSTIGNELVLEIADLATGQYILKLQAKNQRLTKRFTKQ